MKVLKFGGTSQNINTYKMILDKIKFNEDKYVIVLSAIKGTTNNLIEFVNTKNFTFWKNEIKKNEDFASSLNIKVPFIDKIKNKLWDLENDQAEIIGIGEFLTSNIFTEYLKSNNIKSKFISSYDVILSNQSNCGIYNKGTFDVYDVDYILNELKTNQVIIIPGFSGISKDRLPCLLGRGGSDTTGSILAAGLNAKVYEIWTDVDGIYTSDPRFINNTKIIKNINYYAAQELAAMGAKVIHPYCILPCEKKNIPIVIKNSFNSDTTINTFICKYDDNQIYAITIQNDVKIFKITSPNMWNNYGFVYDIFSTFKKYNVDVNIINTSQFNITTTTEDNHLENLNEIKTELSINYDVILELDKTVISVIGKDIKNYEKIGGIFDITKKYNIILTSYSSNDLTISWVINKNESLKLAQELHNFLIKQ
jgi:diaminopimelate decarboxylase/aspartate kinase